MKTLYDYIMESECDEIIAWDNDYDIEVYFYKNDNDDNDLWQTAMDNLAKKIKVIDSCPKGVVTDISELITKNLDELNKTDLFNDDVDTYDVIEDIESIISGNVSENWFVKFVDCLKEI